MYKPQCGETLINSSYIFFNSSADRDNTDTTEFNTFSYLNKSIDHLKQDDT